MRSKDELGAEELLMGLGALLASAVLLLIVFSLFRTTLPADRSVVLQYCASEVSGDIATVATSSVPYIHARQYRYDGINISISTDYVIAEDRSGGTFARPLPVRVCPGRYSCGSISWNGTGGFRECLNLTCGAYGTEQSPVNACNASTITDLLTAACTDMAVNPVPVDPARPLIVEKELIYVRANSSPGTECIPCVFVYQR
ncbi:hypothetical protein [Methanocella arvoryzae]|uniref:Uncharacterized protein n=1 Tax=Methanocella arvoryzae (strain DSM 22066 / NBRC 105507 / MRE50) TaxID=351160 RepID=Q0W755_METAR|nr:hypothetical protein [Methanocella arvoryzae]CAJ35788.1 hypothetical protein RCIX330 [Methanocella arvoryzae MRE50]